MLDRSIDLVMLGELKEIDLDIWEKYQQRIHAKWLGREMADEPTADAGGDDAGGDDDGGDDDDE
jgi:hypothetical protein